MPKNPLPVTYTCMVCGWEGALNDLVPVRDLPDGRVVGCPQCKCSGYIWSPEEIEIRSNTNYYLEGIKNAREAHGVAKIPENIKRAIEKMRRVKE